MRRTGGRVRLADSVTLVIGSQYADAVLWDAHRRDDGRWIVTATLPAGAGRSAATWSYDPAGPNLHPLDEPARWLMGVSDEPIIDYITDAVQPSDAPDAEPSRPHLIAVPSIDDDSDDDTSQSAAPGDDIVVVAEASPAIETPRQGELPIEPAAGAKERKARPKGRRASVPSWDEILFGASRGDDT